MVPYLNFSKLGTKIVDFYKQSIFGPFKLFFAHTLRPNQISNMGGVITIWGKDFAADNFNQFEPDLGNKVMNSSATREKNY